MVWRRNLIWAALVAATPPLPAAAQQAGELQQIQRDVREMRQQYESQIDALRRGYEQRMQALEQRLRETEGQAAGAARRAGEAEQRAAQASQEIKDAAKQAAQAPAVLPANPPTSPNAFNPAIGVILDGKFGYFSKSFASYRNPGFALGEDASTPGTRGLSIGESEIDFSANVDQWLHAALVLSFESDNTPSVEEAYLQTTSLPWGFTVKAGRFFSGIGYLNQFHAHAWDFADQALPYKVFFNNQLGDDGVQVRWLAPTPFFLELGGEALRGDTFPASGPANKFVGAYSGFAHVGTDLGTSHSLRTGVSHYRGQALNRASNNDVDSFTGRSNTTILDFVYKWAPEGNPTERNFKFQAEYFFRDEGGLFNGSDYVGNQRGWYAQGVYQFLPSWSVALRHDEVRASNEGSALAGTTLDSLGETLRRSSAALTFRTSEFGRFRLQYNFDETRPNPDHQAYFQYTLELGAHPAHGY